jgi:acetyl esterase/lipase
MKSIFYFIIGLLMTTTSFSQSFEMPLWQKNVPNFKKTDEKEIRTVTDIISIASVQEPNIAVFLPAKRNASGKAVVIFPGGGYSRLAYDWEGIDVAKWLNSKGIAAIVVKYRLPNSASAIVRYKSPLLDAKRALRTVRFNAEKWNINKNQIGIMGFSAGGHLASTLGTHFNDDIEGKQDSIDAVSARPDFMALIYPVVTLKPPYAHMGSRNALLGENADPKLVDYFSNELQVKADTPPTFLVHSADDKAVPLENSLQFYAALRQQGVYSEMHLYPEGGHGFALALTKGYLKSWPDRFYDWLQGLK